MKHEIKMQLKLDNEIKIERLENQLKSHEQYSNKTRNIKAEYQIK